MPYYIALIHKQPDSCYGVSFPDVPGVTTAADTIDEAMQKAGDVLEFAAGDGRITLEICFRHRARSTHCATISSFRMRLPEPSLRPFLSA